MMHLPLWRISFPFLSLLREVRGCKEHFRDVFLQGKADAALAASVFHFGEIKIPELKSYLCGEGITTRLVSSNPGAARFPGGRMVLIIV